MRSGLVFALMFVALLTGCQRTPSGTSAETDAAAARTTNRRGANPAGPDELTPGDWPLWRGVAGDGISRETDWTPEWPSAGPKPLWTCEVGTGFSSCSVAEGRLYTMGNENETDTVYCLNAETGELVWKHSYPCQLVDRLHEGGPACTPTVDGDRVYTIGKEGQLFCLDRHTGEPVWKHDLAELLEVKMPEWGFSCSPLPVGRLLIVEAGRTVAFDKVTGERVWQTEIYRPGYGAPAIFEPALEPLIAVLNNDDLLVVRLADGSEVAKYPWITSYPTNAVTPICSGDTIFISSGYDHGCALVRLVNGQLEPVYENKTMRNHMNTSILWQGHLFGFDGNSSNRRNVGLVCMDHLTGKEKWRQRGLGCGTLLIAAGNIIALGDEGELVTAPAAADGFRQISRGQVLDGRCWTVPVLSHGRIYCRNAAGHVVALDVRSGAESRGR